MPSSISSGNLRASINVNHQNKIDTDPAVAAAIDAHSRKISINLSDGAGANQIETLWHDSRSIPDGGLQDLLLSGAVIQNVFGEDLDFTGLKAILVTNLHATSVIEMGDSPVQPIASIFGAVTDTIKIVPGGSLVLFAPDAAGYAVVNGVSDFLKFADVTSGGGAVPYVITLAGIRS